MLWESARSGMAGTDSTAVAADARWKLPEDADRRGTFSVEVKYPERWFGAGDIGDESTEEASVSVSREPFEEDRER